MQNRIVVTGIGVVTSIGTGREQFWENLLAGRCGISVVESFDTGAYGVHRGAEVKGFDASRHLRNLDPARLGRASQFAAAAARLALEDAGLEPESLDPLRAGVSLDQIVAREYEANCLSLTRIQMNAFEAAQILLVRRHARNKFVSVELDNFVAGA